MEGPRKRVAAAAIPEAVEQLREQYKNFCLEDSRAGPVYLSRSWTQVLVKDHDDDDEDSDMEDDDDLLDDFSVELLKNFWNKKNSSRKRVVLDGPRLGGKTTFLRMLAHDWAWGRLWKDRFDAVVFVEANEDNMSCMEAALPEHLSDRDVFWFRNNRRRVLWLVDDYFVKETSVSESRSWLDVETQNVMITQRCSHARLFQKDSAIFLNGFEQSDRQRFLRRFFGEWDPFRSALELLWCLKQQFPSIYRYEELRKAIIMPVFRLRDTFHNPDAALIRRIMEYHWRPFMFDKPLMLSKLCLANQRLVKNNDPRTCAKIMSHLVDEMVGTDPKMRSILGSICLKAFFERRLHVELLERSSVEKISHTPLFFKTGDNLIFADSNIVFFLAAERFCLENGSDDLMALKEMSSFCPHAFLIFAVGCGGRAIDSLIPERAIDFERDTMEVFVQSLQDAPESTVRRVFNKWRKLPGHLLCDLASFAAHNNEIRFFKVLMPDLVKALDETTWLSIFFSATARDHLELVQLLINCGRSDGFEKKLCDILLCCTFDCPNVFSFLLKEKAKLGSAPGEVSRKLLSFLQSVYGPFPIPSLYSVIEKGYVDCALTLIRHGLDPNDDNDRHPLIAAARNGYVDVVRYLLQYGANANADVCKAAVIDAIFHGHVDVVDLLLDWGADSKALVSGVLYRAAGRESARLVQRLISMGADVNHRDSLGRTPMHAAAGSGFLENVRILAAAGANIRAQDGELATPLVLAIKNGHADIVEYLIRCGLDVNQKDPCLLRKAVDEGHLNVVKKLVELGADVASADAFWRSPVYCACEFANFDLARYLLEVGFSIRTVSGRHPLYYVILQHDIDLLCAFLRRGVDANVIVREWDNTNALHFAIELGHLNIAGILLDHGADIEACNAVGTPLHNAIAKSGTSMIRLLLNRGADINRRVGLNSLTPMLRACKCGIEEVEVLISYGANVFDRDLAQCTAFHAAAIAGSSDLLEYLSEKGLDPLAVDEQGYTPLHQAVAHDNLDAIEYFCEEALVDPNISVNGGPTPIQVAVYTNAQEGLEFLLAKGATFDLKDSPLTLLHLLASEGTLANLVTILNAQSDMDAQLNCIRAGLAPLDCAYISENVDAIVFLQTIGGIRAQVDRANAGPRRCSVGHALIQKVHFAWWMCSECEKDMSMKPLSMHCSECDIDLCENCSKKRVQKKQGAMKRRKR